MYMLLVGIFVVLQNLMILYAVTHILHIHIYIACSKSYA